MQSILDLLADHPRLCDLPGEDLELIAGCGQNTHFRAGQSIFEEGAPADEFYVLRSGRVAVQIHAPGRGAIVVATLAAGDVLGWSWLFPPYRWTFDALALEETSAIALDGACLRQKCEEDTALGYRLMKRFAQIAYERLQGTRLQLLDVYGEPAGAPEVAAASVLGQGGGT